MIDIIVPVYNSLNTLDNTLKSITEQDNIPDIKVYIIDDCSSDDYKKLLKKYESKLSIVYKKLDKNSGPGVARQTGIDISNNKYIVFLDSDDVFYDSNSLSVLYNAIKDDRCDVVRSVIHEERDNSIYEYKNENIGLHGKIYSRSFLEDNNIKFNNKRSNEDTGFNCLIDLCGARYSFIDCVTYLWCNNKESITRKDKDKYKNVDAELYAYNLKWSIKEGIKKSFSVDRLNFISIDSIYCIYQKYCELNDEKIKKKVQGYANEIYDIFIKNTNIDISSFLIDYKFFLYYYKIDLLDSLKWASNNSFVFDDNRLVPTFYTQEEVDERYRRIRMMNEYNKMDYEDKERRKELEYKMFSEIGLDFTLFPPFYSNWGGKNLHIGDGCVINYNFSMVDDGDIYIGNNVLIAPNVTINTVNHPIDVVDRLNHYIIIKDVFIGNNVWIGSNTVILPGVYIGDNSIIGAGSIVTKDIPANVVAVGNPCKVIKKL